MNQLPPDPVPLAPTLPVAQACDAALHGTWLDADAGIQNGRIVDAKALIVGRWAVCQSGTLWPSPHAGIEFGANGRWRLLEADGAGSFSPAKSGTGMYYLLSIGQLEMRGDDAASGTTGRVALSSDRQAFRHTSYAPNSANGIYVRITSTPANGRDNLPSISDGRCTLVGTWDSGPASGGPEAGVPKALSISFDEGGNFVAGPLGADLCSSHTMYGTYRLTPGLFELTQNVGMGFCDFWFNAAYNVTFDSGCQRVRVGRSAFDNCTGGRGYFNDPTDLVKRR